MELEVQAVKVDIERTREALTRSVSALQTELVATADWRHWVRKSPVPCVAGAFIIGFLLGTRR